MTKDLFSFFKTKYPYILPLFLSFALLLTSCGSKSKNSNFDSSSSSDDKFEISNDESVFMSEDLSSNESNDENLTSVDETFKALLKSTKDSENIQYILSSSLALEDKTSSLKCVINKKDGYISSYNIISFENEIFFEKFIFFENDISYIEDDILGKVSFNTTLDDFRLYLKENSYIFDFSDSAYNISKSEDNVYKYNFLESVLDESFIDGLLSPFGVEKYLFQKGDCTVTTENDIINKAFGEIALEAIYDSEKLNATIKFDISVSPICETTSFDKETFTNYVDQKCYNISKSVYNLINQNAYEVLTNSRIYTDAQKQMYYDTSSLFAVDFTNKIPSMSFKANASGSKISSYEKYIDNNAIYEKLINDISKPTEYTISPYDGECSRSYFASHWNPLLFDITQASEYTITETENFYIIEFTYYDKDAIAAFLAYQKTISQLGISDIINADIPQDHSNYIVKKGVGNVIIRKSDFMYTEQSMDIEISSAAKTYNLIYTSEVISLNEDTNVAKP